MIEGILIVELFTVRVKATLLGRRTQLSKPAQCSAEIDLWSEESKIGGFA